MPQALSMVAPTRMMVQETNETSTRRDSKGETLAFGLGQQFPGSCTAGAPSGVICEPAVGPRR